MAALSTPPLQANFAPIHRLAVRHRPSSLTDVERAGLEPGLVTERGSGWVLTQQGYRAHRRLLEAERRRVDLALLDVGADALVPLERRLATIRLANARELSPSRLTALFVFASAAETVFIRLAGVLARLGVHAEHLRVAAERLGAGDLRYGLDPEVDSIAAVWDDGYEDVLQTVGRGREIGA